MYNCCTIKKCRAFYPVKLHVHLFSANGKKKNVIRLFALQVFLEGIRKNTSLWPLEGADNDRKSLYWAKIRPSIRLSWLNVRHIHPMTLL